VSEEARVTDIRLETPYDISGIRRVNELAFGRPDEADLVDALRRGVASTISLVAVEAGEVIGHVYFSPVRVDSEGASFDAVALGPMAVLPDRQNAGIGSALVREGLDECRRRGERVVFVLGHPNFYPRFGFRPSRPLGIDCEYDVPAEVFMVAELEPGALAGRTGTVRYAPEFGAASG
jgi:putative acetyltransferase